MQMQRDERKIGMWMSRPESSGYAAESTMIFNSIAQLVSAHLSQLPIAGHSPWVKSFLVYQSQQLSFKIADVCPVASALLHNLLRDALKTGG